LVALVAAGAAAHACSSSSHPALIGDVDSGPYDGSSSSSSSSGGDGTTPPFDAPSSESDAPIGSLPTVDEPDVPCVPAGGTRTTVFSGADSGGNGSPPVARLQALGANWFGAGDDLTGFVTFDGQGQNGVLFPTSPGTVQTSFVSEGTTIGAMLANDTSIEYQRYDAQGAPSGGRVSVQASVTPSPSTIWTGTGAGGTLGVWLSGKTMYAGAVTAAGASAGAAWQLSNDGNSAAASIAYANGKYAIMWSVQPKSGVTIARFVLADPTGMSGAPVEIVNGAVQFTVVELVATPNGFLALLLGAGGDNHVYTLPLDGTGKVSGPARRLLGADLPWGMAVLGSEVGIVTSSNDVIVDGAEGPRKPMFRPLDLTGHPIGPWVCLDDQVPGRQNQDMAIAAESKGYAVVFKSVADNTVLARFDHLGTGAP
jgi:hypothetical protein